MVDSKSWGNLAGIQACIPPGPVSIEGREGFRNILGVQTNKWSKKRYKAMECAFK